MTIKQFKLPDPGEGLTEAEIVTWHVKPGDTVKINDIVVEIETAKSLVELPVPFAGTVTEIHASEGSTVEVGMPIISVDDGVAGAADPGAPAAPVAEPSAPGGGGDEGADSIEEGKIGGTTSTGRTAVLVGYGVKQTEAKRRPRKGPDAGASVDAPAGTPSAPALRAAPAPALPVSNPTEFVPSSSVAVEDQTSRSARMPGARPDNGSVRSTTVPVGTVPLSGDPIKGRAAGTGRALAKPPVRKLAKDLGVDLDAVVGTGDGGVITRDDVESHVVANRASRMVPEDASRPGLGSAPGVEGAWTAYAPLGERETRVPVKGVRKMTAQAMVGSAFTAPHVTMFNTIDVTATMDLVERLKADREFRDVRVTPMLVLAKALCVAIRRNPGMNAVWDEEAQEIVVKGYVNLGIAAATPRGLLVPNIKDADQMSMLHLAQAIGELTATAREGRTQPAEMAGGTITITNVGVFGVDTGTPIINPGESAIIAFGAIKKKPWVVTDAAGDDAIVIRRVTQLAISFDHRLIDGELGSRFLADLSALLEDPSRGLVWG
ncbi:MAG: dihydrolipoamide acetyltransferase family protein [Lapillicoccus sp.]